MTTREYVGVCPDGHRSYIPLDRRTHGVVSGRCSTCGKPALLTSLLPVGSGPGEVSYSSLPLELVPSKVKRQIARAVLDQSEVSVSENILGDMMVEMTTHVLAHRTADQTVTADRFYDEWESWWQHTKAAIFPTFSRWLRRPPRTVTHTISVEFTARSWVTFPEADLYPVQLGRGVVAETVTWEDADA